MNTIKRLVVAKGGLWGGRYEYAEHRGMVSDSENTLYGIMKMDI